MISVDVKHHVYLIKILQCNSMLILYRLRTKQEREREREKKKKKMKEGLLLGELNDVVDTYVACCVCVHLGITKPSTLRTQPVRVIPYN